MKNKFKIGEVALVRPDKWYGEDLDKDYILIQSIREESNGQYTYNFHIQYGQRLGIRESDLLKIPESDKQNLIYLQNV